MKKIDGALAVSQRFTFGSTIVGKRFPNLTSFLTQTNGCFSSLARVISGYSLKPVAIQAPTCNPAVMENLRSDTVMVNPHIGYVLNIERIIR